MQNKVTIVIPNYNGKKYLDDCLKSLASQTIKATVVIIDNGSSDGSIEDLRMQIQKHPQRYPEIAIEELKDNTGFANAVNVGIKLAKTDYVLLLNNDTIADNKMVERLLSAIDGKKQVFSVSAKMISMKDTNVIDDCGDLYCALGWAFSPGRDKDSKSYSKRAAVTSACAGAAIYNKRVFDRIGYFDEAHFCYLEDVDIGYRARIHGYKNLYEPTAVVYHAGSGTSGSRYNVFKEELTAANNLYFIYKNMPVLQLLINLPLLLLGVIIKQIYFIRKGLGRAYFKGLLKGMEKIASNSDKKVKYVPANTMNYIRLEGELLINCIRRLVG